MTKTSTAGKIAGALGIATGAAAIAAGYYFYGKGGKAHRKQVSAWMEKAKADMLKKIETMKEVTQAAYNKAADEVLAKYKLIKSIDPKELKAFGEELKAHWEKISQDAQKLTKKTPAKKIEAKV